MDDIHLTPANPLYEDVVTILQGSQEMSKIISAIVDWTGINSATSEVKTVPMSLHHECSQLVRTRASIYHLHSVPLALALPEVD